jgi:hypothetical protein
MSGVQTSIGGIYLQDGAAIDIHREHDAPKASLYFGVDVLNGYTDEGGGQVTEKLLEVIDFPVSSDLGRRSNRYNRAVSHSFRATNHTCSTRVPEAAA